MNQLSKWKQELQKLQQANYQQTDNELFNVYRHSLLDIREKLKVYTENAENLSFSTRLEVERLFSVADEISSILQASTPKIEKAVRGYSVKQAEQGYYGVWYTLEQSQNITLGMPLINHEYVRELVNRPVAGKRLSTRLYQARDTLARNMTHNIITGLFEGKSYAEIAQGVNEETEASYKQALRIARTEAGRTQAATTQHGYERAKELGIDLKKQWLATLDKHTRHSHQELDGQIVDIEECFSIRGHEAEGPCLFGIASEDINCRCTTIEVVDGISPELRRDNETKEMVSYRNYGDWLKSKIDANNNETAYNEEKPFVKPFIDHNLSRNEAIKRLRDKFNMQISETSRTKLSETALNQTYTVLDAFEILYNSLPQKTPQIRALTKSKAGQAIAWYSRTSLNSNPVEFGINTLYFKGDSALKSLVEANVKSGWFSKNTNANHVMVHEFGHHIDFQLSKIYGSQFSDAVFSRMVNQYSEKYSLSSIAEETGSYARSYFKANRKNTETFAELFAEAYGDTPREIAKDFRVEFEKLAKEVIKDVDGA
ncbi:hypothetical protein BBX37_08220 [Listeria monocytogenes]|nr:hypothetical protein [Listeria monocytogenes]